MNKYTYSPFGETPSLNGTIFGFTGQRYDSEIEQYNYKARQYEPLIGRFLQSDPVGYLGGMNLYAYVDNDPGNNRDPLGLVMSPLQGGVTMNVGAGAASAGINPFTPITSGANTPSIITGLDFSQSGSSGSNCDCSGNDGPNIGLPTANPSESPQGTGIVGASQMLVGAGQMVAVMMFSSIVFPNNSEDCEDCYTEWDSKNARCGRDYEWERENLGPKIARDNYVRCLANARRDFLRCFEENCR